ncbi:hypothetical protein A2U01_0118137, partial [Trifolium medium]|nr:hypothetical protein [Trifolium medium]
VREIGQAIGVNLKGDNENMLSVLTRAGKEKKTASEEAGGP